MTRGDAKKFLERDYNQCFEQIRHYDSQIWDVCRFAFTAYIAILGTAIGLYQYSTEKHINLIPVACSVLAAGLILGLILYSLAICNRVYYVLACRYINEHRKLFLETKPLGFKNVSGMYMNPAMPPYFNWRSWQTWLCFIIALLNALLAVLLALYALDGCSWRLPFTAILGTSVAVFQIGLGIAYLVSRERKGGSEAVFGKK